MINAYYIPMMAVPASPGGGDFFGGIFPMLVIFVIFYFFLIMPQQKKAKEHQKLLNALKRGDRVLLSGGIYGNVTNVKGEIVEIKISDGVNVEAAKASISAVLTDPSAAPAAPVVIK